VLSENFYWSPATAGDCRDLVHLKETRLSVTTHTRPAAEAETIITVTVSNPNPGVALAIRLKLLHAGSEQRILPAFYEDNYFSLVPHHEKTVRIRMASSLLEGKMPRLSVSGWNIQSEIHPCAR
jgi:mannosylglycoprotein endo-beta-mannosidase